VKKALVALAAVFLAAHLPLMPPALEDIDSINFALGVRDFDVALHQPHPPGYPVFTALGKISTPLLRLAGVPAPEARGLSIWSVTAGAASIFLLFALFRSFGQGDRRAWWATALAVAAPLVWFSALRPLSDTIGLAAALAAQALLAPVVLGRAGPRQLLFGALVAGLAIGVRSQTFVLTLPLLVLALTAPGVPVRAGERLAAVAAAGLGILAWGVPLLVASGGFTSYLVALGAQAGEDFGGVEMLWLSRSPRVLADGLLHTFIWPWGHVALGGVVCVLAAAGVALTARTGRRVLLVLTVAYGPYAAFHLLFQEYEMVRYALPIVVPVAYLATVALDARPAWLAPGASLVVAASLALAVPATLSYAREPSPGFRLVADLGTLAGESDPRSGSTSGQAVDVAFHGQFRRLFTWEGSRLPNRVLKAPHGREWLNVITAFRGAPNGRVAFAADPKRTDLALFDPQARRLVRSYRWGFAEPPFVGGARPGAADLYLLERPGWMADRGWALTAEIGGITARDRFGPHLQPSVAWLRERQTEALLMIAGRHVGAPEDPAVRIKLDLPGRLLDEFDAPSGAFFRLVTVPAGALRGTRSYRPLQVSSSAADRSGRIVPVVLEQFDVQPAGTPMIGLQEGWHEPEYNRKTGRAWRWTGERAVVWVRPVGRDVVLRVAGESPLRYYDRAPVVRVLVGGHAVSRFEPAADFSESFVLPAAALEKAAGQVVIESDLSFVPGGGDERRLALRIYEVTGSL
jgi:hypothetical protein